MSTKDDEKDKKKPADETPAEAGASGGITSLAKAQLLDTIDAIDNRLTDRVNAYRMYESKITYDIRDMILDLKVMSVLEEIKRGNLN